MGGPNDNPFAADEKETTTAPEPLPGDFDWRFKFRDDAVKQLEKWASDFGVSVFALDAFVRDNIDGAIGYIEKRRRDGQGGDSTLERQGLLNQPVSASQFQDMWNDGMAYFAQKSGLDFGNISSGDSGRGPSGPRKPTASEIRAMFDEDELTENVNKMWGAYLVEDAPNARGIARGFINTVVATGGEQEIDFQTFVLGKIRETNRHKLVYRNKPEGTDELEYISPYTQAAQAVIGGGGRAGAAANDVAAGGAALGASADQFRDRLARTPEYQQSKGFINGLEDRVRGVKNLLRG